MGRRAVAHYTHTLVPWAAEENERGLGLKVFEECTRRSLLLFLPQGGARKAG